RSHRTGRETLASSGSSSPPLRLRAERPQHDELGHSDREAPQPLPRRPRTPTKPFVLPTDPRSEGEVHLAEHRQAPRPVIPAVVVHPPAYHRVDDANHLFQALGGRETTPGPDGVSNLLGGLGAYRREEAHKPLPLTIR